MPEYVGTPPRPVDSPKELRLITMTDNKDPNIEYSPPSVKRWGTILDLTAGATQGCSGDTFEGEDGPHSVVSSGSGDPACGN
jgi:hypothetical protein